MKIALDQRDKQTDLFGKINKWLDAELDAVRKKNDAPGPQEIKMQLCGEIKQIKKLQSLLNPAEKIKPEINTMRG